MAAASLLAAGIGALGGVLAWGAGLPMPFLLGAFAAMAAAGIAGFEPFGLRPALPMGLRNLFVAVIGVMIGATFRPGIFDSFASLWLPLAGIALFVPLAIGFNFLLFTRLGRFNAATAFYAGAPGGLIDAIALGETTGGDPRVIALQQFSRIAIVITALPFLFLLATGQKVGSAAGVSLAAPDTPLGWADGLILIGAGLAGLYGGRALRLPAAILVGPLVLSAAVHYAGLTAAKPPLWVITLAQVMVGAGLGARFGGFPARRLLRAWGLALLSVAGMLGIAAALVALIAPISGVPFKLLLIAFAPGGVTETALIALSLDANPVFITTLHLFRILLTVALSSGFARFLKEG